MKKFLIILGALFLVFIVLGGIGLGILMFQGNALSKECSAYADAALPLIVSQWSEKELLDRASPEFKSATTIDQLDRIFEWCSKLGPLQHADPMQGQVTSFYDTKNGKVIRGEYSAKAQFENADATISLVLIKHGDRWQIAGFNVQAPGFNPVSN